MFTKWDGGSRTGLIWLREGIGRVLLNAVMSLIVS
jgi:hypothetical protein